MSKINVHHTKEYDKFKFIKGNREVKKSRVNRLMQSVKKYGYKFTIITVNEKFEIIDGQHRFTVCKELGESFYYVIKHGYGLAEVQILNQNSNNWNLDEFMRSYSGMGLKDYEIYKFFKEKYNLGHGENISLLRGNSSMPSQIDFERFRLGFYKVKDLQWATLVADRVYDFAPYYDGFKRRAFIFAIAKISTLKDYDHNQMITRIRYQSAKLQDQTRTYHYLNILEKIYNFKSRTNLLRFDFAA